MGIGYTRNDTSNNIADGNIINAADLDGEFDAIESAMGTSGHTHDGTSAEGGPVTVLGPVQDFVASATEIKPKTTNTLDIGTSGLLFKNMFLDGVATMGSIKIDNAGTIGSASDADAITISSGGVVTFSQAVSNLGNVTGKTGSGFVLSLQTSDTTIEATNVLGKIEFSAPDEASGTDAILVGASIEALAEATFNSSTNSTALVFKTNTTGAATERMRLTSEGDLHFLDSRKAIFGAGSDLQIFSNGTKSYLIESGSGDLEFRATDFVVKNADNTKTMASFNDGGTVQLRYDNAVKLATTSTGVDIRGDLILDTRVTIDGGTDFASIELGGDNGAFIDFKEPLSEDYNARIIYNDANGFILGGNTGIPVKLAYGGVGTASVKLATTSTGVDITGDLDASSNLKVNGTLLIDASMNLQNLNLVQVATGSSTAPSIRFTGDTNTGFARPASDTLGFITAGSEAMRIDSSGNLLVGKTSTAFGTAGTVIKQTTGVTITRSAADPLALNRLSTDGEILGFYKDGTNVGSIGVAGGRVYFADDATNGITFSNSSAIMWPSNSSGGVVDNTMDIGSSSYRFKDLYLSSSINITGSGDKSISLTSGTGSTSVINMGDADDIDAGQIVYDNANNSMQVKTNGTEAMRITSAGNVGIGTSSPSGLLDLSATTGSGTLNIISTVNLVDAGNKIAFFAAGRSDTDEEMAYIKPLLVTNSGGSGNVQEGHLTFGTSGSEAMRIDRNGNVGIGTDSPSAKFESRTVDNAQAAISAYETTIGGEAKIDLKVRNNSSAPITMGRVSSDMSSGSAGAEAGDLRFSTTSGGTLAERMRIDSSGNVGIGTSSPSYALSVAKTTTGTHAVDVVNNTASGGSSRLILRNPSSDTSGNGFQIINNANDGNVNLLNYKNTALTFWTNAAERMRIDSSGNVGIGTSSPDTLLNLASSSAPTLRIENTDTSLSAGQVVGALEFFTNDPSGKGPNVTGYIETRAADSTGAGGDMVFATGKTGSSPEGERAIERMRIDSDGNLLVGTTSQISNAKLNIQIADIGMAIKALSNGNWAAGFYNSSGGSVGQIVINASSTAYNTSSDYRLKTDAQPMTGASARVQALNPVNFEWIADGTRVDGFLAHEAQEIVPEAVTGTKDEVDADGNPVYQGIDQSKLVPLLTAALQEALTKIDTLETRITALEG